VNEVLKKAENEQNVAQSILFVCLGNICRSPSAEAVFTQKAKEAGLEHLKIDGAGTGSWHIGSPPDKRATAHAKRRGYDLSVLRARAVCADDFHEFDLILAMDQSNLSDLKGMAPVGSLAKIELFLDYEPSQTREVPDPYYGGDNGFEEVLDLVERASDGLIKSLK